MIAVDGPYGFKSKPVPHFIDGDIEKPNPFHVSFNRIYHINMERSVQEVWVKYLELVTKSSIRINRLDILEEMIKILYNLYRDKLAWLKIDELSWRMFASDLSEETVEALNLIKHNNLSVNGLSQSFYSLKMCMLLNSTNINIGFYTHFDTMLELTFLNSKILFFDSDSDQNFNINSESVAFRILTEEFKSIVLLKADKKKFNTSDCLFIPLSSIKDLKLSRLKITESHLELEEQLEYLNYQRSNKNSGFIIPLKHLDFAHFYKKYNIIDIFRENQSTLNEIFKIRRVDLTIKSIDEILYLNELFSDSASHVNCVLDNQYETRI